MIFRRCAAFTVPDSEIPTGVHQFLCRLNSPLYAVIDTARDRKALPLIEESDCAHAALYPAKLASAMGGQGPHLVSVRSGSTGFERLLKDGWGNSWGIYLTGPSDFAAVRRHLRRQLFVKLNDGRQALSRYYDPRVLREHLPNFSDVELHHFFGPLTAIYLESQNGREIHCCSLDGSSKTEERPRSEIRPEQMEAMERAMMTRFVDKTVDFIRTNFPEWSGGRPDHVLIEFVTSMIKFAQQHDIRQEITIQKLIAYKITFQFSIPLRSQLDSILRRTGLDEDSRLEYFKRQVEDLSPLIKVTLEDAAEELP